VLCEKFFRTLQHPPTLSSPPAKPFGLTLRLSQLAAVSGCSAVISEAHDCSTAFCDGKPLSALFSQRRLTTVVAARCTAALIADCDGEARRHRA
jgi:hypothetical protein